MILIRTIAAAGAIALGASILWAMGADGRRLTAVLRDMASDPWTVVTLIDLYLGFVIAAVIIVRFETRLIFGALWAAPIFAIGNLWTAVWLIIRGPAIMQRLVGPIKD